MAGSDWFFPIDMVRRSFEGGYNGTVFAGPVGTVTPLPDALGGDSKRWPALQAVVAVSKDSFFELLRQKAHFLMLPERIIATLKETSRVQFLEDNIGQREGVTDCNEENGQVVIHIPGASQALVRAASSLGRHNDQSLKVFKAIYHEMTHAWLCLHKFLDNDSQKLYADGLAAYQDAKLATGEPVLAKVAFTEAAAYYVGDKIARWYGALYELDVLSRDKPRNPADLQFQLESIALRYEKLVRTYGATLKGDIQSPDLSDALRDAIDKMILDGLPLTKPFAETPLAGVRTAVGITGTGGFDGPIPKQYQENVDRATHNARKLTSNSEFVRKFVQVVNQFGGHADANTYGIIVHNITINSANTSRDPRIKKEFDAEQAARAKDPTFKPSNAYSKVGDPERNTYIREERLAQGPDAITNTIVHEAVHLAGASGLAELAIQEVEQASGFYGPE